MTKDQKPEFSSTPDSRHIREIEGRPYVLYSGLLELAEQQGLCSLDVEVLQYPDSSNEHTAVCLARAELDSGRRASDVGEANTGNMSLQVAGFPLAIASLRAKARALRNILCVGMTCLEELGDLGSSNGRELHSGNDTNPVQTKPNIRPSFQPPAKPKVSSNNSEPKLITPAQEKAIIGMAKRQNIDPAKLCEEMFNAKLKALPRQDASKVIEHLKAKAA